MDNAMVKRGIGAVVLAIIAALLLGYLLKDKSRERHDVVDMNLPGTADTTKIPSLSDTIDGAGAAINNGTDSLAEKANETGATVVASATGADTAISDTVNDAVDTVATTASQAAAPAMNLNSMRPGFSIRPAGDNEQRDIVDPNSGNQTQASTSKENPPASNKNSQGSKKKSNENVVASAKGTNRAKDTYKPRLIKERKTRIVATSKGSSQQKSNKARPSKQASTSASANSRKSKTTRTTSNARKGSYAIQLMATSSQSRAKKLAKVMKGEGYPSYITKTSLNSKTLYRVRIRAGKSRNSALAIQKKMKRRYQKNLSVQSSLVVSN